MIFNSLDFILFAIIFFLLWPVLNKRKQSRWIFLTGMSFLFYGWWDWRFLFLILGSGLIDYGCGQGIVRLPRYKKTFLIASLLGNLGALSVFKYAAFFAEVIEDSFHFFGATIHLQDNIPGFALILPVGISFYTFQSLSYTIDIYQGRLQPTRNIFHFFSYLAMFPQLVAGPIIRAGNMLKQLNQYRKTNNVQKWNGVKLMVYGLFQKTVIADNLSLFVDAAFEGKSLYDGNLYWWLVMVAFAFQIYCDFSGYSLIARGLAKYMGYHFKMNFNHPYLASNIKDFWSRWHISLSTWFRDYVYIPLGGSRKGLFLGLIFLWITFLLSGIWHGAGYNFLCWGAFHALLLSIEKLSRWPKFFGFFSGKLWLILIHFFLVTIGWVFFRSNDMEQASSIFSQMFSTHSSSLAFLDSFRDNLVFLYLAIAVEAGIAIRRSVPEIYHFFKRNSLDFVLVAITLVLIIFFRGEGKQFIYFQF